MSTDYEESISTRRGGLKEPKCCCCGVRLGLGLLYALLLIMGIANIVSYTQSYDILTVIQGIVFLACGFVGFLSIAKPSVKNAKMAIWFYAGSYILSLALGIVSLVMLNNQVNDISIPESSTAGLTKSQKDQVGATTEIAKKTILTTSITIGIVGLVLATLVYGLIIHRMFAYKKWLAKDS
eukprot:NODE_148_length_17471_cov_0.413136.p9 type:complete len:181 gc:universal NODE_148_length_17471_cov_0.413136:17165-16623(-)